MRKNVSKLMCSVLCATMVVSMVGCGRQQPTTHSNIYNEVNSEDELFNKDDDDTTDITTPTDSGIGEFGTKKQYDPNSAKPIDIEVGIDLPPEKKIEDVTEDYQCYKITTEDNNIIYVPLVGDFVEAYVTDNFTPSNNDNEISFFWGDSDTTNLTTATLVKAATINRDYFFNYMNNTFGQLQNDATVVGVQMSDEQQYNYKGVLISYWTIEYTQRGTDGIVRANTMSLCFVENETYFVYSILKSTAYDPPVNIEYVIENMYPVIIEYDNIEVTSVEDDDEEEIEEDTDDVEQDDSKEDTVDSDSDISVDEEKVETEEPTEEVSTEKAE